MDTATYSSRKTAIGDSASKPRPAGTRVVSPFIVYSRTGNDCAVVARFGSTKLRKITRISEQSERSFAIVRLFGYFVCPSVALLILQ